MRVQGLRAQRGHQRSRKCSRRGGHRAGKQSFPCLTVVQFADNGGEVKAILPPAVLFDEDTVLIEVGEHPVPISTPYASDPDIKNNRQTGHR